MPALLPRIAAWLVLPLAVLLFAQWPLRDLLQAYSREANDLAQVIFALYMAVAVSAATQAGLHLSADHGPRRRRRWRGVALFACLAPWALFLLVSSASTVWSSVAGLEKFAETLNPGFFLVKAALWLLAALVLVQSLADLGSRSDG